MSKAVLISIQPTWCAVIAIGIKTIEIRKTRPKIDTPFKCYIYCTKAKNGNEVLRPCNDRNDIRNGKVIGEFVCDEVLEDKRGEYADVFSKSGLVPFFAQKKYGKNKPLYGWHISNLKIYDKPKELSEFCGGSSVFCIRDDGKLSYTGVTRPPQSWMYVEELEE